MGKRSDLDWIGCIYYICCEIDLDVEEEFYCFKWDN